jgi:hypothetical protein
MKEALLKRWLHSHEEDTSTQMVFRPATFGFPPSRGRVGFELNPDGSYVDIGIAPADGVLEAHGTWSVDHDILMLSSDAYAEGTRRMRIISLSNDALILQK